jgi:hypothetical protein
VIAQAIERQSGPLEQCQHSWQIRITRRVNDQGHRFTPSVLNNFDILANKETIMPTRRADR